MYKGALVVLALVLVLAVCVYLVSADVQTDEGVFKITDFSGVVTSPDGNGETFTSTSDFKKLLETPIIAESKVELHADMQLQGTIKSRYFLELTSELLRVSWDAKPDDVKPDTLWSDFSGTTYLWMPPSHGISQMTISLEGVIPQPVTEESFDVDGAMVKRTLIKDIPVQILSIKVKDSTSTFTYAQDPQKFVGRADIASNVFVAIATSTNSKIVETKEKINEINQALSDLNESLAGLRGKDETTKSLIEQYEAEKKIAERIEDLFLRGYPDIASEMADDVKEDILETQEMVKLLPIETIVAKPLDATPFVISTIILIIVSIILAGMNYLNKRDNTNRLNSVENYLKTHKEKTVDQSFINEVIGRFRR